MSPSPEQYDSRLTEALVDEAMELAQAIATQLRIAHTDLTSANEGMKFEQVIRGLNTELPEDVLPYDETE